MADALGELITLIRRLRKECPWDRAQTFRSLRANVVEEAHEVKEAVETDQPGRVTEELGDLLSLIVMYSEIAGERGLFDLDDVAKTACKKLKNRHTHVFGAKKAESADEVHIAWERAKVKERSSILDGIPSSLPALMLAHMVQKRAERVGFDWDSSEDVFNKVEEELKELRAAKRAHPQEARVEELGDLLFSVINLSRSLGVDPEEALRGTVEKFRRRFRSIEEELTSRGRNLNEATLNEMDELWNEAKKREKNA
jgi:MazG family protein